MRGRTRLVASAARDTDLAVTGVLYLGAIAALQLGEGMPAVVRAAAATLMAVLLPGYALASALFPHHPMRGALRAAFVIGLGLAMPICLALLMNLTPFGIDPRGWLVAFTAITAGSLLIAARERRALPPTRRQLTFVRPRIRPIALFGAAMIVITVAIAMRVAGGPPATAFTELWALPAQGGGASIELGVGSHEAERTEYLLVVRIGGADPATQRITLDPGDVWTDTVTIDSAVPSPVEATLFRLPDTVRAYRQVSIPAG